MYIDVINLAIMMKEQEQWQDAGNGPSENVAMNSAMEREASGLIETAHEQAPGNATLNSVVDNSTTRSLSSILTDTTPKNVGGDSIAGVEALINASSNSLGGDSTVIAETSTPTNTLPENILESPAADTEAPTPVNASSDSVEHNPEESGFAGKCATFGGNNEAGFEVERAVLDQCVCKAQICEECLVNAVCQGLTNSLRGIIDGVRYGRCPICRSFYEVSPDMWAKHLQRYVQSHAKEESQGTDQVDGMAYESFVDRGALLEMGIPERYVELWTTAGRDPTEDTIDVEAEARIRRERRRREQRSARYMLLTEVRPDPERFIAAASGTDEGW
ncbi:hypothetical protein MMC11_008452 [Xylographa trunciseda]|nr:hypothetical protein [Xylographa trunciseda]